jgi:hypothetical protein
VSAKDPREAVFAQERKMWIYLNLLLFFAVLIAMWALWQRGKELDAVRAELAAIRAGRAAVAAPADSAR